MFNMQYWANEFISKAKEPMNKQMSHIFLQMMMAEGENNFSLEQLKGEFMYQIIDKRAEYIGLQLSEPVKVFLMFMTRSPGTAVMYLYALRTKVKKANMQNLAEIFPMGYLNELDLETMWDKQKGFACEEKIDNCLDGYQFT